MEKYRAFIGRKFQAQGFNGPRMLQVTDVYYLGGRRQYPAFKCKVRGDYKNFKDGDRENFLCREIVRNGRLVKLIKTLTA